MTFVLDNSLAIAWCFEDEQTPSIMAVLDRLTESGAMAPMLWPLEAINVLLMAERRRRISRGQRAVLESFLRRLPVALDFETAEHAWSTTATLAVRFGLTSYDAAYLELAQRRRLPLATLDRALRNAAELMSVELLGA